MDIEKFLLGHIRHNRPAPAPIPAGPPDPGGRPAPARSGQLAPPRNRLKYGAT
jgi:hypothetical protein